MRTVGIPGDAAAAGVGGAGGWGGAGRTRTVGDVRYAVRRLDPPAPGGGAPVLLVHGFPETSLVWRALAPELATDRPVLAPDLRGLGDSDIRGPYDLGTVVADLVSLVQAETDGGGAADGRIDVVGHDIGGTIALALAGTRPDLVRRLVVISGPYRHLDLLHAWHVPVSALPALPEAAFAAAGRRMVPTMVRYAWRAPQSLDREVLDEYVAAYAGSDRVGALLGYYRAAVRGRVDAARGRTGIGAGRPAVAAERSLVVWGAADPSTPLPVGEAVVRGLEKDGVDPASVQFVTLPGVGHFPVEEAPAVVVPLVAEFLRAV